MVIQPVSNTASVENLKTITPSKNFPVFRYHALTIPDNVSEKTFHTANGDISHYLPPPSLVPHCLGTDTGTGSMSPVIQ